MDEKLTPELNNDQNKGQAGAPELTWQDAAAASTETAQAVAETAETVTEAAAEVATETTEVTAQTTPETVMPVATSGFSAAGAVAAQPKKPIGLLVAIGVLVVAIIAVASVFFLNQSPDKAVHKALSTTETALNTRAEKMMQAMPALNEMGQSAKASKNDFSFTFEGLQIADGGSEVAMISNLLKGVGLRGNVVSDPANAIFEMDANLGLAETPLFDFYMMLNPDSFAFGMPMCSDTMFSLVPSTLKADFIASPMYTDMVKTYEEYSPEYKEMFVESMNTQLDMYQALLVGQIESLKTASNTMQLSKTMQDEMVARIDTVYEGAVYSKLPKEGALKVYQVELQGAQVRQMIIDLAKYIYLDSEIMNSYNNMFTPEMLGGMSYKDILQRDIIDPLEKNLPELPTTLTLKVDSKKIVRSMLINVKMPETPIGMDFTMTKLTGDFSFTEDQTVEFNFDAEAVTLDTNETLGIKTNMKETYSNDVSDTSVGFTMQMGEGESMSMDMLMSANKEGKLNVTASMGVDNIYMPMVVKLAMDGGVKKDGDKTIWEYPSIIGSLEETDESGTSKALGSVTFAYRSEGTPLTGAFAPARPTNEIFKMSAEALEAEMVKYETKLGEIMQQFQSLMGGAMGGVGTPEIVAPEDMPQETTSGLDQLTPEENQRLMEYFTSLSDEEAEAFTNLSEEEAYALIQEVISQPAA